MFSFITNVEIPQPGFCIDHHSKILFLGSCFSENIGKKMKELKFDVCINPFGPIYNPVSIANSINLLIEKPSFERNDLSFYNELWFSYSHYTIYSDITPEKCLEKINHVYKKATEFVKNAQVIFITLGTSWLFRLVETGQVVANCHKLPASLFKKEFSEIDNSVKHLKNAMIKLRNINPEIKIVFTVSPIRHFKDGAIGNQRSKAALLLTIAKLQEEWKDAFYFPAYEIFMDELRDYRFYEEDMIHPSEAAINYIWDRFFNLFVGHDSQQIAMEIQRFKAGIKHRPRHFNTNAYKNFTKSLIMKLELMELQYPFLDFSEERSLLVQKSDVN